MSTADPADIDITILRTHLANVGISDRASDVSVRLISGGRSNVTYFLTVDGARYVLRRPPLGEYDARAHDVGREYRVLAALAPAGLPVPQVVNLCKDESVIGAPFYIMRRVEGRVIESAAAAPDITGADLLGSLMDAAVDGLVALHAVDPASVGLGDLGKPAGYARRQVDRWTELWRQRRYRDIRTLDEAGRRIAATAERVQLEPDSVTMVHGDYNLGNLMIAPGLPPKLAAILDWEMATIGHPLMDLALLTTYQSSLMSKIHDRPDAIASLAEFPSTELMVRRYAEKSGRSVELIDFFQALALFKILVLTEQVRARRDANATRGEQYRNIGDSVPELAEILLSRIEASGVFA